MTVKSQCFKCSSKNVDKKDDRPALTAHLALITMIN